MTLRARVRDRADATRHAKPEDQTWRKLAVFAGVCLVFLSIAMWNLPVALGFTGAGCLLIGFAISPDPDRYYLEGFTDGLDAAARLDQLEVAGADARADRAGVQRVPERDQDDEPDGAHRGARPFGRAAPSAVEPVLDLAALTGVRFEDRPRGPALDGHGEPVLLGPRRDSAFPPVPDTLIERAVSAAELAVRPSTGAEAPSSIAAGDEE